MPISFDKFRVTTLYHQRHQFKVLFKRKDTSTPIHKIIIVEKKRYVKWNKIVFLLDKEEVQCTKKGLDKPISEANFKKQSTGTINSQSWSNSNRASMDNTSGGREEEAGTPNPYTCSSNNWAGRMISTHVSYIGGEPGGNQFAQISKKELQAR